MTNQRIKKLYDVVIVGAGPAGSTLGYLLSEKSLEVLVIEKDIFPRPKLCAGLLTWKTRKLVEKVFKKSFEGQFSVENISDEYCICEKLEEKTYQKSPEPFYFVERENYDRELVFLARDKGCEFLFGHQIIDLDKKNNTVFTKSGESFSGKIIVGADGVNSAIRKKFILRKYLNSTLPLLFKSMFHSIKLRMRISVFILDYSWGQQNGDMDGYFLIKTILLQECGDWSEKTGNSEIHA
ncbi:MAG: FAD-dependent monooxygenase [Candidatus Aminicenantaceae bacterium]